MPEGQLAAGSDGSDVVLQIASDRLQPFPGRYPFWFLTMYVRSTDRRIISKVVRLVLGESVPHRHKSTTRQ